MQTVYDIRAKFRELKKQNHFVETSNGIKTYELIGEVFMADESTIFGDPNQDYIEREIQWYLSESRNVYDIPGDTPLIWQHVADKDGIINSNYGWCIFSDENHNQYDKVIDHLKKDPYSRQAVMIYTRPTMHEDSVENGRHDFICTNTVQYLVRDGVLHVIVNMRSNDVVFGYRNDLAWQEYVAQRVKEDLGIEHHIITWQVGSLHVYERHWHLIE